MLSPDMVDAPSSLAWCGIRRNVIVLLGLLLVIAGCTTDAPDRSSARDALPLSDQRPTFVFFFTDN